MPRINSVRVAKLTSTGAPPTTMSVGDIGIVVGSHGPIGLHILRTRCGFACLEEADRFWPAQTDSEMDDVNRLRVEVLQEGQTLVLDVGGMR